MPQIQRNALRSLCNSPQGGTLQAGHSMQCLLIICQHVSAGSPGTPIKVQGKVTQEVQVKQARRNFLKPTAVNLGGWPNAQFSIQDC